MIVNHRVQRAEGDSPFREFMSNTRKQKSGVSQNILENQEGATNPSTTAFNHHGIAFCI